MLALVQDSSRHGNTSPAPPERIFDDGKCARFALYETMAR